MVPLPVSAKSRVKRLTKTINGRTMENYTLTLQPWVWLVIGILVFTIEALGVGGFLLGIGVAAFCQAILLWIFGNMTWQIQLLVFAVNSVVFSVLYWKYFRSFNEKSDNSLINDRASQLIGTSVEIKEPLIDGRGRVQIGDTLWKVESVDQLTEGSHAAVVASKGMTLVLEKR